MKNQKLYLKQNIQIEPLVNSWYGWIHLIPPVTSSLNLLNRYLKIMNSYVDAPDLHAEAINDPDLQGGPFMDFDKNRVKEVETLIANTEANNYELLEFARAIIDLDELLSKKAKGLTLEPLYESIPEPLKGYVELYYDMHHNPSFRFLESLLYKSKYYSTSAQSIALSEINQDKGRPFILSTPRLPEKNIVHLPIAFKDSRLDDLFKMKESPQTFDYIADKLEVKEEDRSLFSSFFTTTAPNAYQSYDGDDLRIRYFGHACILIETKEISILLDPILSYTYEAEASRYTYEDLPDNIDYVLITHGHQDHILLETMLQIRHKVKNVVIGRNVEGAIGDPSLYLLLKNLGFKSVIELREMEEIEIPGGTITGIPFLGEHHDLLIQSKLCYFIKTANKSILAIADSVNIQPKVYENVYNLVGKADVIFLGMECDGCPPSWVYGPLFPKQLEKRIDHSRRGRGCNFEEGMKLVNQFSPKEVYIYAMGLEPWLKHILNLELTEYSNPILHSRKLIAECINSGINAELLYGEKEIILAEEFVLC